MAETYPDSADPNWPVTPVDSRNGIRALNTIRWAGKMIGRPYRWGAGGPNAFDCSGLVYFAACYGGNVNVEHVTDGGKKFDEACKHRWTTGTIRIMGRTVSKGQELPGDLIMPHAGHVGIVIGHGLMIDAPTAGQNVGIHKYDPTPYAIRRIFTPTSVEQADKYTGAGTKTTGDPTNPDGSQATGLDEGAADPVGLLQEGFNALMEPLAAIAKIAEWLATPHNWMRIGEVLGGSVALVIATRQITRRVK